MDTQSIHEEIVKLQDEANKHLKDKGQEHHRFFYGGQFISGNLSDCKTLILSFNPGFEEAKWKDRERSDLCDRKYSADEIKYIKEYRKGLPFAKALVGMIFNGKEKALENCAETYVYSPFASPSKKHIDPALNSIREIDQILWDRHHEIRGRMVEDAVRHLKPDNILIVGVETWGSFSHHEWKKTPAKRLGVPEGDPWVDNSRVVGKAKTADGTNIFVCKHLSIYGGLVDEIDAIREEAKALF